MTNHFYPVLIQVSAKPNFCLHTVWNTGETLELSVHQKLLDHSALHPILDPDVFKQVHISEWGQSVEWFDEEFGADNIYAWAKEQAGDVSHQMFDEWMRRNDLSLTSAAQALGMSRRMISYYRSAQKPIPKAVWLACLGWEITKPKPDQLPRFLPSVQQYAQIHA